MKGIGGGGVVFVTILLVLVVFLQLALCVLCARDSHPETNFVEVHGFPQDLFLMEGSLTSSSTGIKIFPGLIFLVSALVSF